MLKIASSDELSSLIPHQVKVFEFFSGRRYKAEIKKAGDRYMDIRMVTRSLTLNLNCGANLKTLGKLTDKSMKIGENGDYLHFERVDTSGKWGRVDVDMCDGRGGRVYCDIGVSGWSRRSADGTVRWARMIAVSRKSKYGHPIYKLPDALEIEDEFIWGTLLDDETAVLTFNKLLSVRVDLAKGALLEYRPDVAMVSLDSWAALKHIMNERWDGADSPCLNSIKLNKPCEKGLVQMYFYTLQQYLFPTNRINWN